jgi:1,4-dihydroxy-6-naphthoate synthase
MMTERTIRVGHSPDPDDAFMFYGLASGRVKLDGIRIEHVLEDIQSLNTRAAKAELEVTAISAHAYPFVQQHYWIMRTGASIGDGYGPVLISKKYSTLGELRGKTVGTPGPMTTATLLFRMFTEGIGHIDRPFDQLMDLVNDGRLDAAVVIHEGQLTYPELGFRKILDFGELWREKTGGLPLPLGLDVVRKDLGLELAKRLSVGLRDSIDFGYAHQGESIPYALKWGRGIDQGKGEKFVKMYVNDLTIDMGARGEAGLKELYRLATGKAGVPALKEWMLV